MFENFSTEDHAALRRFLKIADQNLRALEISSRFLHFNERSIHEEDILQLCTETGLTAEDAYLTMLCALEDLDFENTEDREIMQRYLKVHCYDSKDYRSDPYYSLIKMPEINRNDWRFGNKVLHAYEGFTADDLLILPDGRELPQIGFFKKDFPAPAVYQSGREWMTVTPSEQNTMLRHIRMAHGKLAVFGLGLGYYAFMTSQMPQVSQVDVIELSNSVIDLFKQELLPQFPNRSKINLIQADAFEYAKTMHGYDVAYVDIWHDVLDGTEMYLKMKRLESLSPETSFLYWIEPSMLCFLHSLAIWEIKENKKGPILDAVGKTDHFQDLRFALSHENLRRIAYRIPTEAIRH